MKKRFVQILSVILGMVFLLVSSIALADSSHFETNINSKFGSEADEIKVKKISHQIGTNLTLEVNLPELSHQDNDKQISINVGTLKAGEEKNYLISRKAGSVLLVTDQPPTSTNTDSRKLPTTNEEKQVILTIIGLLTLLFIALAFRKHRKKAKYMLVIVLIPASLGGAIDAKTGEIRVLHIHESSTHKVMFGNTNHDFFLTVTGDYSYSLPDSLNNSGVLIPTIINT